ncbi:MAG: hypothetical protein CM15mP17_12630 [Gammaproteobacteria bacterium]|nr:MAG: hypothetical protein CM15mP17_12630 [Gammaproteobacteria bacterium]
MFLECLNYSKIDFNNSKDFETLNNYNLSKSKSLFYLAVSPSFYTKITENLNALGSINDESVIVVEKPIGEDLNSSVKINQSLASYFDEQQIFRIDHYLGKEAVQNLLALRFGNILFEKVWSNIAIDHVQITVAETLGLRVEDLIMMRLELLKTCSKIICYKFFVLYLWSLLRVSIQNL